MNAVLLTGAGFTKPFGGYLASEMWATILNQPEIQNSPELRKGMLKLDTLDYEMFYEEIQCTGTEQQKRDLNAAIRKAFKEMDDNIRTRKPNPLKVDCCRFICRIAQDQPPSFIFTLNQDLFFERYHDGEKITVFPGVPDHLRRFKDTDPEDSSGFSLRLPTAEELEPRKDELFREGSAQIAYVKLHGSQGWLSHTGSDVMVIGTQKASLIENEPLLKWYFALFEKIINRPDTRLLVVGYGFRDEHINDCLINAISNGLKLYVISPLLPEQFRSQCVNAYELWEVLGQYWTAELTNFYQEKNGGEPTHRGRALLRGLGLA